MLNCHNETKVSWLNITIPFHYWLFALSLSLSEGHSHCCNSSEAVIRLVLSALVGVATVAFLVYDVRSTSGGDKKQIS